MLTFKELPCRIDAVASSLLSMGFKKGDILAIHLPNCPEYCLIFHAVNKLGGVCATVNPAYTFGRPLIKFVFCVRSISRFECEH